MYEVRQWNKNLDLKEFYKEAHSKGFFNNSSEEMLVKSISKEKEWAVWILYFNDKPVGSVAAHSLDESFGLNSYRIAARTCVFTDKLSGPYSNALRTLSVITKHQNPTSQFFIPTCIEWAGKNNKLYITSHPSEVGSQKLVHNIFCPQLAKTGILKLDFIRNYRGHDQHFWMLNVDQFYKELEEFGRWK